MAQDSIGTIAANVRAEIARQGVNQTQAAAALGIARPTLNRKMHGHFGFTAVEIQQLADLLNVPISVLYQPIEPAERVTA